MLVQCQQVLSKCRLGYKTVIDQFLPSLAKRPIPNISLPNVEYLGNGIGFEELYVGDDVKEGALVHPIGKTDHFGGSVIFLTIQFLLSLLEPIRVDMDNALSRNSVVLV